MNKTIPKQKKCTKAKLSEEALQIAEEKREAKDKGERGRYIQLNADFQRIARRDKKAFLYKQCKRIEENNTKGKTRDLFIKIGGVKGTFHVRMGIIKDRNGRTSQKQKRLRRGGKNTQQNYIEKFLMTHIPLLCGHSPRARHSGV